VDGVECAAMNGPVFKCRTPPSSIAPEATTSDPDP